MMSIRQTKNLAMITGILLLVFLGKARAEGKLYKFQFAPENAPAFSDFARVNEKTGYSASLGHGFKDPNKLVGTTFPVPEGDDLARSYIANKFGCEMEFLLDVPNGEYEVCFWMGQTAGAYFYPRRSFSVHAEGELKYQEKIDTETYYQKYYPQLYGVDNYNNEKGIWKTYISPRFPLRKFLVDVKDGQLNIVWEAEKMGHPTDASSCYCAVNGLLVYPVHLKKEAEMEIRRADRTREKNYNAYWREVKPEEFDFHGTGSSKEKVSGKPLSLIRQDEQKGYVLFARHYMDFIYPSTVPYENERVKELRAFATRGEYEPVSFSVYPLSDLKGVSVSATDLRNKEGDVIKKDSIKTEIIIYTAWPRHGAYTIMPTYGMEEKAVDIPAGITKQYFLTVKVPPEAKGGLYQGKIIFSAQGRPSQEVALKLNVLPFELLPLEDHNLSFQWFPFMFPIRQAHPLPEKDYWKLIEERLIDQKEMGCTQADWTTSWGFKGIKVENGKATGKWKTGGYTLDDTEKYFSVYAKVFPNSRMVVTLLRLFMPEYGAASTLAIDKENINSHKFPSKEWEVGVRYIFDTFKELSRKYNLKPPIFYVAGEVTNYGLAGIKKQEEVLKVLRNIPDITLAGMNNGLEEAKILNPYYDIVGLEFKDEEDLIRAKEKGKTIFLYQAHSRLDYGFLYWRWGAKGTVAEFYNNFYGDPFNCFDSTPYPEPDISLAADGPGLKLVHFLAYHYNREGIDDAKYLNTLSYLIKRATESGNPDLVKKGLTAQQTMDSIMANVNPNRSWYWADGNFWPNQQYDTYRWKIAAEIINLKELLK